jgi:hypothetical protein
MFGCCCVGIQRGEVLEATKGETMSLHPEMHAEYHEPSTLERLAAREPGAQPPPPPPESDPDQDYDQRHMGNERPASNDAGRPLDELESASFPARAETLGVRREALRDA